MIILIHYVKSVNLINHLMQYINWRQIEKINLIFSNISN